MKKMEEDAPPVPPKSAKQEPSGVPGNASEDPAPAGLDPQERAALELEMRRQMEALGLGESAGEEEEEEEEDDESAIDVEDEAQLASRGLRKIMIEGSEEPFLLDLEGNIFSLNGDFMGNLGGGVVDEAAGGGFEEEEEEDLLP